MCMVHYRFALSFHFHYHFIIMITFLQNQNYSHSTLRHIQQLPQICVFCLDLLINNDINLLLAARAAENRPFVKIVMFSAGEGFNFACSFFLNFFFAQSLSA